MPELPDVVVYIEALRDRILGHRLERITLRGPFLLRTVTPPVDSLYNRTVTAVARAGKRIAIGFDNGHWLAIHLMIAGRLHWNSKRQSVAAFAFDNGTLTLTEAGTQHRAQIHVLGAPPRPHTRRRGSSRSAARNFFRRPPRRKPHPEAFAHRPAPLQRHRQRLL